MMWIVLAIAADLALLVWLLAPTVKPWDSPEERALMFAGGCVKERRGWIALARIGGKR